MTNDKVKTRAARYALQSLASLDGLGHEAKDMMRSVATLLAERIGMNDEDLEQLHLELVEAIDEALFEYRKPFLRDMS